MPLPSFLKQFNPYAVLRKRFESHGADAVQSGPFKGLKYGNEAYWSALLPKLIGTYEKELHGVVQQIIQMQPQTIIDIGAAEGFYACGLAQSLPKTKVVAFEMDLKARYLLEKNIRVNGLADRVTISGFCDMRGLNALLDKGPTPAVVICDVEGHEYDLLNKEQVPKLIDAYILVEMHDFYLPGVSDVILQRFAPSHKITQIAARARTPSDFPYYSNPVLDSLIPAKYFLAFVDEQRPGGMSWLWMEPKSNSHRTNSQGK